MIHSSVSESRIMSSDVLFCPTNSLKPQNIPFTIILNREKQEIFIFERLKTVICLQFLCEKWEKKESKVLLFIDSKIFACYFSVNQFNHCSSMRPYVSVQFCCAIGYCISYDTGIQKK